MEREWGLERAGWRGERDSRVRSVKGTKRDRWRERRVQRERERERERERGKER